MIDLRLGDCLDVLATLEPDSIDACVTDPPYHLTSIVKRFGKPGSAPAQFGTDGAYARASAGFMGKQWDGGDIAFRPETWAAVLRVLKPGAHLLAFGGTRTYHRLACAVEDAGFEIRDMISWVYGSGFPKSHNLDGDWEGWGTALKPALEPIVFARKPLIGMVAENVATHRTGALNIDGCRVMTGVTVTRHTRSAGERRDCWEGNSSTGEKTLNPGRWPANLIHDGSDDVLAAFPDSSGSGPARTLKRGKRDDDWGMADAPADLRDAGTGSAARFFYCAKASKSDRNDGCDGLPDREGGMRSETSGQHITRRDGGAPGPTKNNHPTVKPTDLMRYLCRLVTPPGGTVLDPFMGSGSTGRGAVLEAFGFVGIEREAEYMEIAKARIAAAQPASPSPAQPQYDLFGALAAE